MNGGEFADGSICGTCFLRTWSESEEPELSPSLFIHEEEFASEIDESDLVRMRAIVQETSEVRRFFVRGVGHQPTVREIAAQIRRTEDEVVQALRFAVESRYWG